MRPFVMALAMRTSLDTLAAVGERVNAVLSVWLTVVQSAA
jgi:hypothetical protein